MEIHQNKKDISGNLSESKRNKLQKCIRITKEYLEINQIQKQGFWKYIRTKKTGPKIHRRDKRNELWKCIRVTKKISRNTIDT